MKQEKSRFNLELKFYKTSKYNSSLIYWPGITCFRQGKSSFLVDDRTSPYLYYAWIVENLKKQLSPDPAFAQYYPAGIQLLKDYYAKKQLPAGISKEKFDGLFDTHFANNFGGLEMCIRTSPDNPQEIEISWNTGDYEDESAKRVRIIPTSQYQEAVEACSKRVLERFKSIYEDPRNSHLKADSQNQAVLDILEKL